MAAADRATRQIERLLAFSRRQRLAPESVDINALVAGMTDLLEYSLGSAIALQRTLEPALPPVRIDPGQLEDALMNLAINARDAMQGQGRIDFTTTRLEDGTIEIAVSDTGCGMSPELAERVFEPFFTTKPAGKGSGLGLSMVYGFVRQSGGSIAIDSAPGQGTRIRIRLPAAALTIIQGTTAPGAAVQDAAPRGAGETILVVDEALIVIPAGGVRRQGFQP
jgi:signal transduction histidine kinase